MCCHWAMSPARGGCWVSCYFGVVWRFCEVSHLFIYCLCVCVRARMYVYMCVHTRVPQCICESKRTLGGVDFLPLLCGSLGLNSDHQTQQQALSLSHLASPYFVLWSSRFSLLSDAGVTSIHCHPELLSTSCGPLYIKITVQSNDLIFERTFEIQPGN